MTLRRKQKHRRAILPTVLLCLSSYLQTSLCRANTYARPGPEETYSAPAQEISVEDYPARLHSLHSIVADCMRLMSATSCDWKLVGPDSAVRTSSGIRKVEFTWLRSALRSASVATSLPVSAKDQTARQAALTAASNKLRDAGLQLDQELARQQKVPASAHDIAAAHAALKSILASGGYAQETPPTLLERLRDAFLNWLGRRLNAIGASGSSQLVVNLLLISLIVVACGAILWWFARKVQSQRLMLSPTPAPNASAPSAQDWQKWLDQGMCFAREQQWREAIHHVYWSAISCLESRGLWPADRARTPREYLNLLTSRPETRANLYTLTRSFECTWYGDQPVGQPEFDQACALLERLAR